MAFHTRQKQRGFRAKSTQVGKQKIRRRPPDKAVSKKIKRNRIT